MSSHVLNVAERCGIVELAPLVIRRAVQQRNQKCDQEPDEVVRGAAPVGQVELGEQEAQLQGV